MCADRQNIMARPLRPLRNPIQIATQTRSIPLFDIATSDTLPIQPTEGYPEPTWTESERASCLFRSAHLAHETRSRNPSSYPCKDLCSTGDQARGLAAALASKTDSLAGRLREENFYIDHLWQIRHEVAAVQRWG